MNIIKAALKSTLDAYLDYLPDVISAYSIIYNHNPSYYDLPIKHIIDINIYANLLFRYTLMEIDKHENKNELYKKLDMLYAKYKQDKFITMFEKDLITLFPKTYIKPCMFTYFGNYKTSDFINISS